jgi:hypothetical protein
MTATSFSIFLIVLAAMALAVLIWMSKHQRRTLFIAVPVVLLFATTTIFSIHDLMGRPAGRLPSKDYMILDSWTDGKTIYVWHIEQGKRYPQTFELPYSTKKFKELQHAKRKRESGTPVMGRGTTSPRKGGDSAENDELQLYDFTYQQGGFGKDPS